MSRTLVPAAVFAAAYLGIFAIVLAPEGYFLGKPVVAETAR